MILEQLWHIAVVCAIYFGGTITLAIIIERTKEKHARKK